MAQQRCSRSERRRERGGRALCIGALLALLVGGPFAAGAVEPWVDTGFVALTPPEDVDLVIVRERALAHVDLSFLGLGEQDYVQSLYFRLYAGADSHVATVSGVVVLPEGVRILGFVRDGGPLGGVEDDRRVSQTDALFGIDTDPDDYSADARGFESGGGRGGSEFILSDSERSFAFALNVLQGVDDFRVLIDYGSAFAEDLAFELRAYPVGELGGAPPALGIQVGQARGGVPGSGDFGEVSGLIGIPLTATAPPRPLR